MLSDSGSNILEPAGIFVRKCSSLATFSLVIWDGVVNCNQEYKYIWKNPSPVKWIYLFCRYYGIGAQTTNLVFVTITLSRPPTPSNVCDTWVRFQLISFICLLTALEAVLVLRVYVLYQKSQKIGSFLGVLLVQHFVLSMTWGFRALSALDFDLICNAQGPTYDVLYFGVSTLAFLALIWLLTIRKRDSTLREEWGGMTIVNLLACDGTRICMAICSMLMVIIPYAFFVQVAAHVIFLWPMALMSILACRLILDLQRLKSEPPLTDLELTTRIGPLEAHDHGQI